MMPFVLWAVGLLCIYFEFFLPGAVFGFAGSALILISMVLFAHTADSMVSVLVYGLLVALSVAGVIKLALYFIRKSRSSQSFLSDKDQAGYIASSFDKAAIGKQGVVLSDLKPGGYVLIDGQKLPARSASGYIVAGSKIEVIAGDENTLVVQLIATKGE